PHRGTAADHGVETWALSLLHRGDDGVYPVHRDDLPEVPGPPEDGQLKGDLPAGVGQFDEAPWFEPVLGVLLEHGTDAVRGPPGPDDQRAVSPAGAAAGPPYDGEVAAPAEEGRHEVEGEGGGQASQLGRGELRRPDGHRRQERRAQGG